MVISGLKLHSDDSYLSEVYDRQLRVKLFMLDSCFNFIARLRYGPHPNLERWHKMKENVGFNITKQQFPPLFSVLCSFSDHI